MEDDLQNKSKHCNLNHLCKNRIFMQFYRTAQPSYFRQPDQHNSPQNIGAIKKQSFYLFSCDLVIKLQGRGGREGGVQQI
jgi:hypothetical protein